MLTKDTRIQTESSNGSSLKNNTHFLWSIGWYMMGVPVILILASKLTWGSALLPPRFLFSGVLVTTLYALISANRFITDYHLSYRALGLSAFYASIGFVAILSILAIMRIDYSRTFLLAAYCLMIGWFAIGTLAFRKRDKDYFVIEGGSADKLAGHARLLGWPMKKDLSYENKFSEYDAVVVDLHAHDDPSLLKALTDSNLDGTPLLHAGNLYEQYTGRSDLDFLAHEGMYKLAADNFYQPLKRMWEIVFVLAILPLLIPVMLVVAAIIKLESSGSALFTQDRIGKDGKPFTLYKFRSMREDAEKDGAQFADKNDNRITRFGAFIRKFRIDELPQFWNVLKGDMSIIGPRPEQPEFVEFFKEEIPFYAYRHKVRPGITGWAQINSGYASDIDATIKKLEHDLYYIKNINFSLDLLIVYATVRTILTGFGSR